MDPFIFFLSTLQSGSCVLLLVVGIASFYVENAKSFFRPKLTYKDDTQQIVRFCWVFGWALNIIAAFVVAHHHKLLDVSVWRYVSEILWNVILVWVIAKVILLLIIICEKTWSFIFRGKPLWK